MRRGSPGEDERGDKGKLRRKEKRKRKRESLLLGLRLPRSR